jgi:hypothetical protein
MGFGKRLIVHSIVSQCVQTTGNHLLRNSRPKRRAAVKSHQRSAIGLRFERTIPKTTTTDKSSSIGDVVFPTASKKM